MDTTNKTNWIIGGVVIVVIAVVGWWLFTKSPVQEVEEATTGTVTGTTSNTNTGVSTSSELPTVSVSVGEEVTVEDQPAGDSVRVAEAKLSRVSWVAVRDDMRIYGAAKVTPPVGGGTMQDITVPLLRNTEAGKMYKVVVYADDGDNAFDFKKDALVDGLEDVFNTLYAD
jgi:hypothetical protein